MLNLGLLRQRPPGDRRAALAQVARRLNQKTVQKKAVVRKADERGVGDSERERLRTKLEHHETLREAVDQAQLAEKADPGSFAAFTSLAAVPCCTFGCLSSRTTPGWLMGQYQEYVGAKTERERLQALVRFS